MKKTFIYLVLCLTLISCSTTKSIKHLKQSVLTELNQSNETLTQKISSINSGAKSTLPSKEEWKKDRDDFVLQIESYLDKNSLIKDKSKKTNNFITISGTAIGVGGGIYGLATENQDMTTSITSILVGGLTTVISTLDLEKKEERSANCNEFLSIILLDFKYQWGEVRYPQTKKDLALYISEKNKIIERIKKLKCFD